MQRLVLTTSDSGAGHLKTINRGQGGKVLCLTHRLVSDPVPSTRNIAEFFDIRKSTYETELGRGGYWDYCMDEGAADRFEEIRSLWGKYSLVEFWVDPLPNAQLILIQFLDWCYSHWGNNIGNLQLIQADSPLGDRHTSDLRSSDPVPRQIDDSHLNVARLAWNAFSHSTPERWAGLLSEDLGDLPCLQQSVLRMLEELPEKDNALGKTETQILELIAIGKTPSDTVLRSYTRQDAFPVLDYWEAGKLIDLFSQDPNPAVVGLNDGPFNEALHNDRNRLTKYNQSQLTLSEVGHDLLNKKVDLTKVGKVDRWWGGTRLTNDNCWRWDGAKHALIRPN